MKPSRASATSSASPDAAAPFPPLFGVSCHWADPWLIAAGTRAGSRHTSQGVPTEDAIAVTRCGPHVLLAIADGAGDARATRSAEGAQRAVAAAAAAANRSWHIYGPDRQLLTEALAAAHVDLVGLAARDNLDPATFATTLMIVLLAGNRIVAARVGDGSLYTWDRTRLTRFCPAPLPATATPMLVQPDWRDWMSTAETERDFIHGIVLCSVGADDFFLDEHPSREGRNPSAGMFAGIAKYCDDHGPTAALGFVTQMLNDPGWARKTADDRSLIFALKPQSPKATPVRPPR